MAFVFKVSPNGVDAKTMLPEQAIIHSQYPSLKSRIGRTPPHHGTLRIDFTQAVPQGTYTTLYSEPHGYDRRCLGVGFITSALRSGAQPAGVGTASIGANLMIRFYTTDTNIVLDVNDNFNWIAAGNFIIVDYYIYTENA